MRGIIMTELMDYIESATSENVVEELLDCCELPSGGIFTSVGNYSHLEVVQIVTALSHRLNVPSRDLIMGFGEHLFRRFAELYPAFFEEVECPLVFLQRVEPQIHVEVLKLYPDARLPRVAAVLTGKDELTVHYQSHRPFADVAEALICGCMKYFGSDFTLTRENPEGLPDSQQGCVARFIIRIQRSNSDGRG